MILVISVNKVEFSEFEIALLHCGAEYILTKPV